MKHQLIFTPAPKPAEPFNAVAAYAGALIDVLQRKISETGELDTTLADKIESLLWGQRAEAIPPGHDSGLRSPANREENRTTNNSIRTDNTRAKKE